MTDAQFRAPGDDTEPTTPSKGGRGGGWSDSPWVLLSVFGIVAAGIAFRLFTRSELWADEALTVNIANLPLADLQHALRHDGAPPLYYVILHGWMRVFGTGNFSARALSGFIGIISLVPIWFAGRRLDLRRAAAGLQPEGARPVAWAALILLSASPFAIRYATEARMYALVILLVTVGVLAVWRAYERPNLGRLAAVAVITAALVYTHYWSFALIGTVGVWFLVIAWRGPPERRGTAWRVIAALAVGLLAFVPWLGVFRDQLQHTGTPWGSVAGPLSGVSAAFKAFGGNQHVAGWAILVLAALAVFARAVDRRHVEVDLWTRPGVRVEAGLGMASLTIGLSLAFLTSTTFEGRYAAVSFPLVLLAAAFGVTVFASRPVRYGVLVAVVALGFWGGVSNAFRQRTQAVQVAYTIEHDAKPGDVVVYCPDYLGADVSRLLPGGLKEGGFPDFAAPGRVDWVDYEDRISEADVGNVGLRLVVSAGPNHDVWLVTRPGDPALQGKCEELAATLARLRPNNERMIEPDAYFYEAQGLVRFRPGRG